MNYFEVQKYLSLTFHTYTPAAVLINPKLWNSLTADQKTILQKSMEEARQFQRKTVMDKEADDLAFLKSKGMVVTEKPDAEAFRKATAVVYESMARIVPPALVKKVRDESRGLSRTAASAGIRYSDTGAYEQTGCHPKPPFLLIPDSLSPGARGDPGHVRASSGMFMAMIEEMGLPLLGGPSRGLRRHPRPGGLSSRCSCAMPSRSPSPPWRRL